ncbi:hypothetical protein MXAN_5834 [Myxococcus xanthus DK 1622]|uniref:Uncharacterized protein n=1 Tax=Myxococcus xanthus (strain DK1622) TaxID=246197 RepID=Q1D052_MYXXD|nr:hypothetical protein MXAN_5834 [Myxococcus xanthus DK 1622]
MACAAVVSVEPSASSSSAPPHALTRNPSETLANKVIAYFMVSSRRTIQIRTQTLTNSPITFVTRKTSAASAALQRTSEASSSAQGTGG